MPRYSCNPSWTSIRAASRLQPANSRMRVPPTPALAAAFKDVTNAKEDREKLINQSQSYRNDILPKAQGEAAQVVNQAKGNAQSRLNRAQGEANRFVATLREYNQAKDIISK